MLSFTTVSVALDRGAGVLPYRWADDTAAVFAAEHDAVLAVGRSVAGAYESGRGDLQRALHECVSERELAAGGFAGDVDVAAEINTSAVVPGWSVQPSRTSTRHDRSRSDRL